MPESNRANRRRIKPAAFAGVALAATALTAAIAPPAAPTATRKLDVVLAAAAAPSPTYGIGPLGDLVANIVDIAGLNPVVVPLFDPLSINWNFLGGSPTTKSIYQKINDLPYTPVSDIPYGAACSGASQANCRTAFLFNTGIGALGAQDAVRAFIDGALGKTPAGFDPLKPASGTGLTLLDSINVNSMLRPNGGLGTRFPGLLNVLGVADPVIPALGYSGPNKDGSSVYNFSTSITWPYNPLADFPITANPFSIANSLIASIPPIPAVMTLLDPATDKLKYVTVTTAGTIYSPLDDPFPQPTGTQCIAGTCEGWNSSLPYLGAALAGQIPVPVSGEDLMLFASRNEIPAWSDDIPLAYPLKLTSWLVNPILKNANSPYLLGTPLADILSPALRILVNIGYDDVLTPAKVDSINPYFGTTYRVEQYREYDRTYAQLTPTKPTPFAWLNNPALTREETTAAYVDAWNAFTAALKAQAEKPGFGIFVPNPDVPPAPKTAAVAAAAQAVSVKPAASAATPVSAPAAEPAPAPAPVADPAPVKAETAPIVSEPSAKDLSAAVAEAPEAPSAPAHRGGGSDSGSARGGGSDNGGSDNGGSATRGHRGGN